MWTLIYVAILASGQPNVIKIDTFDTMVECFQAREYIVRQYDHNMTGHQLICIRGTLEK